MNSISLFDKKYTGGLDGARGYHFEDAYILSQLPSWLSSDNLEVFQQELLTDLELFFESEKRWFIQIKNHQATTSEFREIMRDFEIREKTSGGQYEKYKIVSPGLTRPIAILQRELEKLRTGQDYTEKELARSREEIVSRLVKLKCDDFAELILEKVYFHSNIDWVKDEEVVRDRFVGSLVRRYEINPKSADDLYFRIARLLVVERGKPVPILSIRKAIEQKQVEDQANRLSQFDLITTDFLDRYQDERSRSFFFAGAVPTWADVIHRRDIPREVMNEILPQVEQWSEGILLMPVLAEGGEGKSTLLRRLAVELSKKRKIVLYHRRDVSTVQVKEVEWIIQKANECIYVFIDDAPRITNFSNFIKSLTNLSFPIVLIVASRSYEWEALRSSVYSANLQVGLSSNKPELFLEGLTDREMEQLFRLLIDAQIIPPLSDVELKSAIEVYGRSSKRKLLVLVLELIQGKKAVEIIRDEIEHIRTLGNDLFAAYRYICLMSSVRSFLSLAMLQKLVTTDNIGLDIAHRLPGLVEVIGNKIYVRHDKIGEIATDIMFERADEQRGDSLCRLISIAFEQNQTDAIKPMINAIRHFIPQSQILRVLNHLVDEAYCFGEFDIFREAFKGIHMSPTEDVMADLLIDRTPLIWERLVFPPPKLNYTLDWKKIQEVLSLSFSWPECNDSISNRTYSDSSLDMGLEMAYIYEGMVRWGDQEQERTQFFLLIAEEMYKALAIVYEEETEKIYLAYADFLRAIDSLRGISGKGDPIELYHNVLKKNPNNARAHLGLAVIQYFSHNEVDALHHYRATREHDWDLVFQMDEADIMEKMLEQFGLWEELIELKKENISRFVDIHGQMQQDDFVKETSILFKLDPDRDEHQKSLLESLDDIRYDENELKAFFAMLDQLPNYVRELPESQQDELGKQVFRHPWFGELRHKLPVERE